MHEDETGNEQSSPNYSALKPLTDMERKKITNNNKINQKTTRKMTEISQLYIVILHRN